MRLHVLLEPGYTPANLRALLRAAGMTREAAADLLGVQVRAVHRWCAEPPSRQRRDMPLERWLALLAHCPPAAYQPAAPAQALERLLSALQAAGITAEVMADPAAPQVVQAVQAALLDAECALNAGRPVRGEDDAWAARAYAAEREGGPPLDDHTWALRVEARRRRVELPEPPPK